ncbi:hypothetical protein H9P43_002735 [Blastocladiella emersonii ATCC 22665]|nr:hypothetical protein H9P43_002735 [Blastocladiella emersonii ATCC 22665]
MRDLVLTLVREFQLMIGRAALARFDDAVRAATSGKADPDAVMTSAGGESNSIDRPVRPLLEAGGDGDGVGTGRHSATLSCGMPNMLRGTCTKQGAKGQVIETHSMSAGLADPCVGCE